MNEKSQTDEKLVGGMPEVIDAAQSEGRIQIFDSSR